MLGDTIWNKLSESALGATISQSPNVFPWIETVHVLAIVCVVGTISIVDLRLVGVAAHVRSIRALSSQLLPVTWGAFAIAVMSGLLLFISKAPQYVENPYFLAKVALIAVAGLNMLFFHFVTGRTADLWDEEGVPPLVPRIGGAISLALWIGVIFTGRWIGFTLSPF